MSTNTTWLKQKMYWMSIQKVTSFTQPVNPHILPLVEMEPKEAYVELEKLYDWCTGNIQQLCTIETEYSTRIDYKLPF